MKHRTVRAFKPLYRMSERGAIAGIEGLAFGVLVFAFGTLLILNAWSIVDGKLATDAAAREAARALAESSFEHASPAAARERATELARDAIASQRGTAEGVVVDISPASGSFNRCRPVDVRVSLRVPRVALPLIGGHGGSATVSSRRHEIIDPYRSGTPGDAAC